MPDIRKRSELFDEEFTPMRKVLERAGFKLDRKRIGTTEIFRHKDFPDTYLSFYDQSWGWSTDAPPQVGIFAGYWGGRSGQPSQQEMAMFDRAVDVLTKAGFKIKGTTPYSKIVRAKVGSTMSIAKIVAKLVERGEGDLAEELLSIAQGPGFGIVPEKLLQLPEKKLLDILTQSTGNAMTLAAMDNIVGKKATIHYDSSLFHAAIDDRKLRRAIEATLREMRNQGVI